MAPIAFKPVLCGKIPSKIVFVPRIYLKLDNWFSSKSHENMIFWNVKSYSCIYLNWIHSKIVAKEALDRNSWILDEDLWFRSKSHQNMIFWNVKSYSCINLKWVHPINVAKEALDRNSWIFDADHWFSSKSGENMIFVQSYSSIYLKWFHSKCGYRDIRQK